jgi:hypothetical protein
MPFPPNGGQAFRYNLLRRICTLGRRRYHRFILRFDATRQLAASYGVSKKVLQRWLKPHQQHIGQRNGHKYSLQQMLYIIEIIG